MSFQAEIWPTQPYLGTLLMFPLQARAVTRPPRSPEWFLVSGGDALPTHVMSLITGSAWNAASLSPRILTCGSGSEEAVQGQKSQAWDQWGGPGGVFVFPSAGTQTCSFGAGFEASGLPIKTQQPFSSGVIKAHGRRCR